MEMDASDEFPFGFGIIIFRFHVSFRVEYTSCKKLLVLGRKHQCYDRSKYWSSSPSHLFCNSCLCDDVSVLHKESGMLFQIGSMYGIFAIHLPEKWTIHVGKYTVRPMGILWVVAAYLTMSWRNISWSCMIRLVKVTLPRCFWDVLGDIWLTP